MRSPRETYIWPIHKRTTPHIRQISKQQLGTCQHNIPTTSPVTNAKTNKEKGMFQNLKIKITPRVIPLAHIKDTTTNKDTTAPSRGASLGAHVSETSQATSPSHTVEKI